MFARAIFEAAFTPPPPPERDLWEGKRRDLCGQVPYLEVRGKREEPLGTGRVLLLYVHGN